MKGNFVQNLKNYFFLENKKYKDFNYRFVLKTNYLRSYWISENKKIRATIDTNISTSPINDLNKKLNLSETILEFKFSQNNEFFFRKFFQHKKFKFKK